MNLSMLRSDADIVVAVLAGEREAFAELVRRYERAVHAVAMQLLRDHHAAQDVCQETFVAAYRSLSTLRDHKSFGAWLVTIARNQARSALQRRRHERTRGSSAPDVASRDDPHLSERLQTLLEAIMELREHERVVILLRYFSGHDMESIGAMTAQPAGTVASQLHRARAHLREIIEEKQR